MNTGKLFGLLAAAISYVQTTNADGSLEAELNALQILSKSWQAPAAGPLVAAIEALLLPDPTIPPAITPVPAPGVTPAQAAPTHPAPATPAV